MSPRRTSVLASVAAVVLLGALFVGRAVGGTAQDATPAAAAGHPFAGDGTLSASDRGPERVAGGPAAR